MRVLVTGASGFVGAHTVQALVHAGHQVRATARSAQRVRRALRPLGVTDVVEVVEGDISDDVRVRELLRGCDAVIHAAAVYSHDVRRNRQMLAANVRGAETVLRHACEAGLDPVVHISSYVALLPAHGTLTPDSPVGRPPTPYARSKARAEAVARRLQDEGAPVTIVHPGMVWGPHDPALGESTRLARDVLAGRVPMLSPGAVPLVDVRDLALVHAAAMRPGAGPRRFLATGEIVTMAMLMRTVAEAGGRRPPRGTMPGWLLLGMGRMADLAQRLVPYRLPLNYQGPWAALHCPTIDASATTRELGVQWRPTADTLRDTVEWLREAERVVA